MFVDWFFNKMVLKKSLVSLSVSADSFLCEFILLFLIEGKVEGDSRVVDVSEA
jgi:hypothetical protein